MESKQQKGFTLIELLVVIAIIGILSAIGLVSLSGAREKARDAQRKSDVSQIRTALILFYDDQTPNGYPNQLTFNTLASISASLVTAYMDRMPVSPATANNGEYYYISDAAANSTAYALMTKLESQGDLWFIINSRGYGNTVAASSTRVLTAGSNTGVDCDNTATASTLDACLATPDNT